MGKINFRIQIEVVEAGGCELHRVRERYTYPDDIQAICPWLMDSANAMIRVLQFGGRLPWTYRDTPYEKYVNDSEQAVEFVRCPDPTVAGVVIKITKTQLTEPREVGWC